MVVLDPSPCVQSLRNPKRISESIDNLMSQLIRIGPTEHGRLTRVEAFPESHDGWYSDRNGLKLAYREDTALVTNHNVTRGQPLQIIRTCHPGHELSTE